MNKNPHVPGKEQRKQKIREMSKGICEHVIICPDYGSVLVLHKECKNRGYKDSETQNCACQVLPQRIFISQKSHSFGDNDFNECWHTDDIRFFREACNSYNKTLQFTMLSVLHNVPLWEQIVDVIGFTPHVSWISIG